ncbi:sigma-70 family RNA polymerase sigma factor [Echinicola sp. CAU 1574]|uniref:Sigma-70 family RNA polymerase sigma factor n=1 Tax=Echinicola arenosa TaxID=2774144 RepID=A0ABR9AEQ2_9BACT|nr:sigma-70 family RNA polymerase sigma factor [Echinicola arenosa]MBD8487151.1 sigma-70 family RNA polymerase sigma factor [Echinicola arenosa]
MEIYRPLLFTYAYNILGSVEEAEDLVQDVFFKYLKLDQSTIKNEKSYLSRMVINGAINLKKSSKSQKESYPGLWLPEPIDTENSEYEKKEILTYSLMILMEKLDPKQRAVFVLREAFDYSHEEISSTLEISQELSRQLLSRAKKNLKNETNQKELANNSLIVQNYIDAIHEGNIGSLEKLLKEDILVSSDGGGKASASRKTIIGLTDSIAMFMGLYKKFYKEAHLEFRQVNHQPAIFYYSPDGSLNNCQVFAVDKGQISHVYFIRNPDKLKNLEKKPH